MLCVHLYKVMQIAWLSTAAYNLSTATTVPPALLGSRWQLLLMIGMFKVILTSQAWYLLCFYSLFGEAKVGNFVAALLYFMVVWRDTEMQGAEGYTWRNEFGSSCLWEGVTGIAVRIGNGLHAAQVQLCLQKWIRLLMDGC